MFEKYEKPMQTSISLLVVSIMIQQIIGRELYPSLVVKEGVTVTGTELLALSSQALVSDRIFHMVHYKVDPETQPISQKNLLQLPTKYVVDIRDEEGKVLLTTEVSDPFTSFSVLEAAGYIVLAGDKKYRLFKYKPSKKSFEAVGTEIKTYPGQVMMAGYEGSMSVLSYNTTHMFNINLLTGATTSMFQLEHTDTPVIIAKGFERVVRYDTVEKSIKYHEMSSLDMQRNISFPYKATMMIGDSDKDHRKRYFIIAQPSESQNLIISAEMGDFDITNKAISNRFTAKVEWLADIRNSPVIAVAVSSPSPKYLLFVKNSVGQFEYDTVDLEYSGKILSTLVERQGSLWFMTGRQYQPRVIALGPARVNYCNCMYTELTPGTKCRTCEFCYKSSCVKVDKRAKQRTGFDWNMMNVEECEGSWAGCISCNRDFRKCNACDNKTKYQKFDEYTQRCYNTEDDEIPSIHPQFGK